LGRVVQVRSRGGWPLVTLHVTLVPAHRHMAKYVGTHHMCLSILLPVGAFFEGEWSFPSVSATSFPPLLQKEETGLVAVCVQCRRTGRTLARRWQGAVVEKKFLSEVLVCLTQLQQALVSVFVRC
jgi:hypothetical protein